MVSKYRFWKVKLEYRDDEWFYAHHNTCSKREAFSEVRRLTAGRMGRPLAIDPLPYGNKDNLHSLNKLKQVF
jgi:hypothetical protein